MFVLVARDILAADKVRAYAADLALHGGPKTKIASAYAVAEAMDQWRATHRGKLPD